MEEVFERMDGVIDFMVMNIISELQQFAEDNKHESSYNEIYINAISTCMENISVFLGACVREMPERSDEFLLSFQKSASLIIISGIREGFENGVPDLPSQKYLN